MKLSIDYSLYNRTAFTFNPERSVLLKHYHFSEKERQRPLVQLENPIEDAKIFSTQQSKDIRSGYPLIFEAFKHHSCSTTEKVSIIQLKNMLIGPGGMILDPVTKKSYSHWPYTPPYNQFRNNIENNIKKIDVVFPLLSPWGSSWGHFMIDLIDQLVYAKDILIDRPEIKILIDGPPQFDDFWTICQDILKLKNDFIYLDHRVGDPNWNEILQADEIIYCQYSPVRKLNNMVPKMAKWVQKELIPIHRPIHERNKIIYISRAIGPQSGARRVENETDIINALTQRFSEYEVVKFTPPDYNIYERIELFSKAKAVISLHGGGNANLFFAPPKTIVIECLTAQFPHNNFLPISGGVGHEYWAIPISGASHDDPITKMPIDKIIRTLKKAMKGNEK